jgi:replication factor C large subunit
MWTEKYRPASLAMLVGNEEARLGFLKWLKTWKVGGKAALLVGSPGIGKTATVHASARELGYSVIELNASDIRTKDKLDRALGPSIVNQALIGRSLILLDEVDGIFGRADYGGLDFVLELMESTSVPLVMIANAQDSLKIDKIARKTETFRFQRIPPRLVELYLRGILSKEGKGLDDKTLQDIIIHSKGDMRSAINDLQAALLGELKTDFESPEREISLTISQSFQQLFDASNVVDALMALSSAEMDPKGKIETVFSSLVTGSLNAEYLTNALDVISQADQIIGRIQKTQEWRQLRYFDVMLAVGLFYAMQGHKVQFNDDAIPWDLKLRLWNEAKYFGQIGRTLGPIFRTSRRQFSAVFLPYFTMIIASEKDGDQKLEHIGVDESTRKVVLKEGKKILEALK